MKNLMLSYLWIILAALLFIMIARIVLLRKLYRMKDEKLFGAGMGIEMFSAVITIFFPFNIPLQAEPATHELVKKINKLKNYYWWVVLAIVAFVVIVKIIKGLN